MVDRQVEIHDPHGVYQEAGLAFLIGRLAALAAERPRRRITVEPSFADEGLLTFRITLERRSRLGWRPVRPPVTIDSRAELMSGVAGLLFLAEGGAIDG